MLHPLFITALFSLPFLGGNAFGSRDCAGNLTPIQQAECHGLHSAPTPYEKTPFSPLVRMIRENGKNPLDVHACVKMDVISGTGPVSVVHGQQYYANPYPYIGFEMVYGPDHYDEYIEAGLGYSEKNALHPAFFSPYIRRAPDELDVAGAVPPDGFINATRAGKVLPGYWIADTKPELMIPPDGEFCFVYSFNPVTDYYHFEFDITKSFAGTPTHFGLEMPSARWLRKLDPTQNTIHSFASRILTSIAITNDDFHPEDPAYKNLVFGAAWRASVLDQGNASAGWVPYDSDHFQIVNSDPTGRIIFYSLDPLK